jgi:homoserine dehydrogenase
MKDKINIGIIGFGAVGTGVVKILQENANLIERRLGIPIRIKNIADIDTERYRGVKIEEGVLISDPLALIEDPEIEIIIELIGGIEPAKTLILKAMEKGKDVVTANKALLALHGEEIHKATDGYRVEIGFEGAVGGGIPIIRAIKEGLVANNIESIYGIINGTSNYILTKMTEEGKGFSEALQEAQSKGYAEADPTLDIEGIDSAHKLVILSTLAFGTPVDFNDIYTEGISKISPLDIGFAREFGYKIKLLAIAKMVDSEIELRVHPTMIPEDYLISTVDGIFNAIYVIGDALGPAMFYGRGAGQMPTASAVLSDIIEIGRNAIKGSKGRVPAFAFQAYSRKKLNVREMEEVVSKYYLRFSALDRPGVLSKISGVLGAHNISISSVIQKGRKEGEAVPVVMMTHEAKEKDVRNALFEIDLLPVVDSKTVFIRVEGEGRYGNKGR